MIDLLGEVASILLSLTGRPGPYPDVISEVAELGRPLAAGHWSWPDGPEPDDLRAPPYAVRAESSRPDSAICMSPSTYNTNNRTHAA